MKGPANADPTPSTHESPGVAHSAHRAPSRAPAKTGFDSHILLGIFAFAVDGMAEDVHAIEPVPRGDAVR
jgi:hypothetical protein